MLSERVTVDTTRAYATTVTVRCRDCGCVRYTPATVSLGSRGTQLIERPFSMICKCEHREADHDVTVHAV